MTATRPSSDPARPPGATPVGGGNRGGGRRKALLLGGLLLALLLLAGLLLSQCGSDDPEGGADGDRAGSAATSTGAAGSSGGSEDPSASSSASPSAGGGSAPAGGAAGGGQLVTADGQDVLQLAGQGDAATALGGLADQAVTGTGVQVLSVPADEGFWVGSSEQQRVWVQLTGEEGESPYQVTEGDVVDFEGTVVAHDATFAEQVGLADADGAAELTELGSHIEVEKGSVTLTG